MKITPNAKFDAIIEAEAAIQRERVTAGFGIDFATRAAAEDRLAKAKATVSAALADMPFAEFREFAAYRMAKLNG